jgi:hypothetical protein
MKKCPRCGEYKPLDMFCKNKQKKDGLNVYCKPCHNKKNNDWDKRNPEKKKNKSVRYKAENPEKVLEAGRKSYHKNKHKHKGTIKLYQEKNKEKKGEYDRLHYINNRDRLLQQNREYVKNNPDKNAAKGAKQRARKMQATPLWLTDIQLKQIEWFYAASRMMTETTGVEHHVDHIYPLKGKKSCGLHVPWNLRCIPAKENLEKATKIIEL